MSDDSTETETQVNASANLAPSRGPFDPIPDTARTVNPFLLFDRDNPMMDLRFKPEPEESMVPVIEEEEPDAPDPKDSSAPESANSSPFSKMKTIELPESSESLEETASAEKDSGQPKESGESGTPTS